MRRIANLLVLAAGMIGLTACGFAEPARQDAKTKPQPKPAPALVNAAINALQPVAQDARIQQVEQQYGPQLRQLYRSELHFMRVVTQPTKPQFERIAAEDDGAVKEAIRKAADVMFGGVREHFDPRSSFTTGIAKLVETTLSPEQAALYRSELGERSAAEKRATVLNFVAAIDKDLLLTADQRAKLIEILHKNWDRSWDYSQWLTYAGQYFPVMPDASIRSILTESQQTVWNAVRKGNINFGGIDMGFFQGIEVPDEVWGEEPPKNGASADKDKGVSKVGGRR